MLRTGLAVVAMVGLLSFAARADESYTFAQTGQTGAWSGQASFSIDLTDAAVRSGSFFYNQVQTPFGSSGGAGLVSFSATIPNVPGPSSLFDGDLGGIVRIAMSFGQGGRLTGADLILIDDGDASEIAITGTSGVFLADYDHACDPHDACTLSGSWTHRSAPVPEPASLAILGTALLGLVAVGVGRQSKAAGRASGVQTRAVLPASQLVPITQQA